MVAFPLFGVVGVVELAEDGEGCGGEAFSRRFGTSASTFTAGRSAAGEIGAAGADAASIVLPLSAGGSFAAALCLGAAAFFAEVGAADVAGASTAARASLASSVGGAGLEFALTTAAAASPVVAAVFVGSGGVLAAGLGELLVDFSPADGTAGVFFSTAPASTATLIDLFYFNHGSSTT